ncbi:hypothetical protein [Actinomadura madurae]|nr:hypothetical protein [Actinomadura madurae]
MESLAVVLLAVFAAGIWCWAVLMSGWGCCCRGWAVTSGSGGW